MLAQGISLFPGSMKARSSSAGFSFIKEIEHSDWEDGKCEDRS